MKEFDVVSLKDGREAVIQEVFPDECWVEITKESGGPSIEIVLNDMVQKMKNCMYGSLKKTSSLPSRK